MEIRLIVKRQDGPDTSHYEQEFSCRAGADAPVSALLEQINSRDPLTDSQGREAGPIRWQCSCRQQVCGACAMLINGRPRLACNTFMRDLGQGERLLLRLAPLSKFPVQRDLWVDRSALFEDIKRLRLWLEQEAVLRREELPYQYQSASCLMCGCCLEICPNYAPGNGFGGAALMNQAYRTASQYPKGAGQKRLLKDSIRAGQGHCSKTLSCREVCPLDLPLSYLISRGNFLYIKSLFSKGK